MINLHQINFSNVMEMLFSLLFLVSAYFLTTLALVQGNFPWFMKKELDRPKEISSFSQHRKTLGISMLIAVFFTLIMFYFFIYP